MGKMTAQLIRLSVFAAACVPLFAVAQESKPSATLARTGDNGVDAQADVGVVAKPGGGSNRVSNSIPAEVLAIEQKLESLKWKDVVAAGAEIPFSDLIAKIEASGIPVILDDSSDLKMDTPVTFLASAVVGEMRLVAALEYFLRENNSDFKVSPDALFIYSIDKMADRLERVVYNVSPLIDNQGQDIDFAQLTELIQLIQNAVEPTTWDMEGPSIRPLANGKQGLLTAVNTYAVHRQIRRLFDDLSALSDGAAIGRQAIIKAQREDELRRLPLRPEGGQFAPAP